MNQTCEKCGGKCCQTLVYPTARMSSGQRELLETREVGSMPDVIWINAPCKYLVDGRCSDYASRPRACIDYPVHGMDCVATRRVMMA